LNQRPCCPPGGSGRLLSIDMLRGMAALAVLFHHSYASFLEEASRQSFLGAAAWLPMDLGKRGVELFLVISGFCIHMGYARARSRSQDVRLDFVRFWKRRLLRLYPPYLASMVLSLSVGILYATMRARREGLPLWPPDPYGSGAWLGADILTHLLMIHIFFYPFSGGLYNGVFWSLALEEQLYALYFPLRSLFRHLNVWRAMGAVTLMCLAFRALGLIDWPFPWFTQGPARWIEWSLGAVALEVFVGRAALPRILRSPLTTPRSAIKIVATPPCPPILRALSSRVQTLSPHPMGEDASLSLHPVEGVRVGCRRRRPAHAGAVGRQAVCRRGRGPGGDSRAPHWGASPEPSLDLFQWVVAG